MSEAKQSLIERAKLLQHIEQYDDMAVAMKKVVEMEAVLSKEERDLLSVAYQKVIERRLTVWRILRSIEQKTEGSEQRRQMAKEYRDKVEGELKEICAGVLGMLDHLVANSASSEDKALYRAMWHSVSGCVTEVAGICHVAKIADKDLLTIFEYLPPYERLIASEVCVKWRDLSAKPWRDVINLDLSQVPSENIDVILRKCPKLASVSALRQNLGDLCRFFSRLNTETSLKCFGCELTAPHTAYRDDMYASLRNSHLRELIWHRSCLLWQSGVVGAEEFLMPLSLPRTLRRLELVALDGNIHSYDHDAFELPLLESVILADLSMRSNEAFLQTWPGFKALYGLRQSGNLRELYLDSPYVHFSMDLLFASSTVEVLFLNNITFEREQVARLILEHRSLRVLVLTASRASDFGGEVVIPVRKRFPNGFHADPVPQLQLFLGKIASQRLRFTPSESDALTIHLIDAPLPQFLEKDGVKSMFEGSWIASRIRELAENGESLVDYCFEGNTEEILYTQ